ncbi:MAG: glutamate ABC transporter substrate-binding protein [Alicyclobacillaceae bacterium]|nr:glutamate ABC transporter substrate-binding protein [Alicyclobacillaceae bacterium]
MKWSRLFAGLAASVLAAATLVGCGTSSTGGQAGSGNSGGATASGGYLDTIKKRGYLIAGVKYDTKLFGLLNTATNQPEGFDVDLMKELAKKIFGDPSKVQFKQVTSSTRIPMLQNGEVDILAATMTITEDRKKQIDFSDVYFKAGQSLLVKKDSPIRGIQDLDGKTVLAVQGSTSEKNIKAKAPNAQVKLYSNYQEAFEALRAGKGDALTTDNAILMGMAQQDPNYHLVGGNFTDEPYGFGIAKGHEDFLKFVNDWLKEIKQNGTYKALYQKWFKEDPPQD